MAVHPATTITLLTDSPSQTSPVLTDHLFANVFLEADRCLPALTAIRAAFAASATVARGVVGARAVAGVVVDGFLNDGFDE